MGPCQLYPNEKCGLRGWLLPCFYHGSQIRHGAIKAPLTLRQIEQTMLMLAVQAMLGGKVLQSRLT